MSLILSSKILFNLLIRQLLNSYFLFYRVTILNLCINLIDQFAKLYESNSCFKEIFEITSNLLDLLPSESYPIEIQVCNYINQTYFF